MLDFFFKRYIVVLMKMLYLEFQKKQRGYMEAREKFVSALLQKIFICGPISISQGLGKSDSWLTNLMKTTGNLETAKDFRLIEIYEHILKVEKQKEIIKKLEKRR